MNEEAPKLLPRKRPTNARSKLFSEGKEEEEGSTSSQESVIKIFRGDKQESLKPRPTGDNDDATKDKVGYQFEASGEVSKFLTTTIPAKESVGAESKILEEESPQAPSGQYLGRSKYYQFRKLESSTFKVGPVRGNGSMDKNTCRFDYAPDLCKDWNETGFCGFGDSCKFLHDRGDYKAGWELEQDWEERVKKEREGLQDEEEDGGQHAEEGKVTEEPSICKICEKEFQRPVVKTRCNHYFCERCAIQNSRQSKSCFVCGFPVNGQFTIFLK